MACLVYHEAEESRQHTCLYCSRKTSQSLGAAYHLIIARPVPSKVSLLYARHHLQGPAHGIPLAPASDPKSFPSPSYS
jgi:hypothetical protein